MSDNDLFPKRCWLEMSIRIVSIPGETDSAENMINLLHCFAPNPLSVGAALDIGSEKGLLAADGDMIEPTLGWPST
jgi:hypothetical protein